MDIILFNTLGTLFGSLLSSYVIYKLAKKKSVLRKRPSHINF